jgi:hypothetical protein
MDVLGELHSVAAKFEEKQPICVACGRGRLVLIDEKPDPTFGILGLTRQTLKCDSPRCGELVVL